LTIDVITGTIHVLVLDPQGKSLFQQVITKKATVDIKANVEQQSSLYYSE